MPHLTLSPALEKAWRAEAGAGCGDGWRGGERGGVARDPGGMAKLIVKLQSCELAHQISALAIDAMGEIGVLYHGSERERDGGAWQWNYK